MAASTSSRGSSPLSDVVSPPPEDTRHDRPSATNGHASLPVEANASSRTDGSSRLARIPSPSRSQRSPTSSTVERAESDLTDFSDDEQDDAPPVNDEDGDDDDGEEEDDDEYDIIPIPYRKPGKYAASPSSSQSLSPAPSSTERKSQTVFASKSAIAAKRADQVDEAAPPEVEVESDLGSLTDSNDDGDDQDTIEGQDEPGPVEAKAQPGRVEKDAVGPEMDEDEEDDGFDTPHGRDEDEEEDGDGDITMRAIDGLQALAEEATMLPNGTGPSTEDDRDTATIATDAAAEEEANVGVQEGVDAEGQAELEEPEVEEEMQDNGEGVEPEEEEEEAAASPAPSIQPFRPHSTHAPPPTTAAMKALLSLEVKFAALRDRLYVERMEETAAEEEMILNGSHPALGFMFKNLLARRERLHEVASRRHRQVLDELAKVREEEKECVWTWWTEERDREQWEEFEQTWVKRRRLIREKSELDIGPKRPKPVPKSWADAPRPLDWAAGAVPSTLSARDAAADLAMMVPPRQHGGRQTSSPSMYGFAPNPHPTQYYQHSHIPHPVQPEPVYASRVPIQQPQTAQPSTAMPRHGQSGLPQGTYGNAVFNVEPRREGRTVPTTSGLFDTARRPPSTEMPNNLAQSQPMPQQPPSLTQGTESKPSDPWNNRPPQTQVTATSSTNLSKGPSPVNGNTVSPPPPVKEENPTQATAATNDAQSASERFRQRYPGLANYLNPTAHHSPAPQRMGALSPPKSSLGITGVPTPFI